MCASSQGVQIIDRWHGRASDLADPSTNKNENERYWTAFRAGDAENTGVFMGQAAGPIHEVKSARTILEDMVEQAAQLMAGSSQRVRGQASRPPAIIRLTGFWWSLLPKSEAIFVTKGSIWNSTPSAHDGRRARMGADALRTVIERAVVSRSNPA